MDPSYGRYLGPHHSTEIELEAQPSIKTTRRRVFLDSDGNGVGEGHKVELVKEELQGVQQEWIYYKSWEKTFSEEQSTSLPGRGIDIVFVHGLGDSGGRWAKQVEDSGLLDEGFRVWTLDLATIKHF
ncbi:hypothetical protein BDY24DRAFT_414647 [Mrakia frigida]|uniref:uncharacterized protein n=1 Tax=Mrakia frigida TaxID=29902 RepID=UPI003FCC112B